METPTSDRRFRFGEYELQPAERRLLRHGQALVIGARAFDLLLLLVEHAGSLVLKEELLARVWPRVVVEENAVQAQVSALRRLLGKTSIATVSGRGYRFTLKTSTVVATQATSPKHNLPHLITSFIGRELQLQDLARLLGTSRLVTLTGAGGCGKTRLAIQAAFKLSEAFSGGRWMVDLSALTDPASVVHAVAATFAVQSRPGETLADAIAADLSDRQCLLLIDNVEHVIEAAADLTALILLKGPGVTILATGREPLGLEGEVMYRVPSLTLPDARRQLVPSELLSFEAVRLFVERIRLHTFDFELTNHNAAAAISVCRRLDGIPLALELAAARIRTMSMSDLERRLDQQMSLLASNHRHALPRHVTLRALIDWSHSLLQDAERVLFCRLAVFSGGFDLGAVESICSDDDVVRELVPSLMSSLADKSLVQADDKVTGRFGLLETVRQYALERLTEQGDLARFQQRHLDHFVHLVEDAEPRMRGPEQQEVYDRIERDHENIRLAMSLCASRQEHVADGLRITACLEYFWVNRGHMSEGRDWCTRMLALATEHEAELTRAKTWVALGTMTRDVEVAQKAWENALNLGRMLDNKLVATAALRGLGSTSRRGGKYELALAYYDEALALSRQLNHPRALALALNNLALFKLYLNDHSPSVGELILETLAIQEEVGNRAGVAMAVLSYSFFLFRPDPVQSRVWNLRALVMFHELGNRSRMADCFDRLAYLAGRAQLIERAGRFYGAADCLHEGTGVTRETQVSFEETFDAPPDDPRRGAFDAAIREGQAMTFDQAWAYAHAPLFEAELAQMTRPDGSRADSGLESAGLERAHQDSPS